MQICATLVCNTKNSDEQSIICVNYVLRYIADYHTTDIRIKIIIVIRIVNFVIIVMTLTIISILT